MKIDVCLRCYSREYDLLAGNLQFDLYNGRQSKTSRWLGAELNLPNSHEG